MASMLAPILVILIIISALLLIFLGSLYTPHQFWGAQFEVGSCELVTLEVDPNDSQLVRCDCGDDEYSCTSHYPCLEVWANFYPGFNKSATPMRGLLAYDSAAMKLECLLTVTCTNSYTRNEASAMRYWNALSKEIEEDLGGWFRCWGKDGHIFLRSSYSRDKGIAAACAPAALLVFFYIILLITDPKVAGYVGLFFIFPLTLLAVLLYCFCLKGCIKRTKGCWRRTKERFNERFRKKEEAEMDMDDLSERREEGEVESRVTMETFEPTKPEPTYNPEPNDYSATRFKENQGPRGYRVRDSPDSTGPDPPPSYNDIVACESSPPRYNNRRSPSPIRSYVQPSGWDSGPSYGGGCSGGGGYDSGGGGCGGGYDSD